MFHCNNEVSAYLFKIFLTSYISYFDRCSDRSLQPGEECSEPSVDPRVFRIDATWPSPADDSYLGVGSTLSYMSQRSPAVSSAAVLPIPSCAYHGLLYSPVSELFYALLIGDCLYADLLENFCLGTFIEEIPPASHHCWLVVVVLGRVWQADGPGNYNISSSLSLSLSLLL